MTKNEPERAEREPRMFSEGEWWWSFLRGVITGIGFTVAIIGLTGHLS